LILQTEKSGNIPLQPIENKLVLHRDASINENQVGNCPTIISSQPIPSIINTGIVPQVEEIYIDGGGGGGSCSCCCIPSSTMNCVQESYV